MAGWLKHVCRIEKACKGTSTGTIFYLKKTLSKKTRRQGATRQTLQNCHATRRDKGFRRRHPSKQASNKNLVTDKASDKARQGFSPQTSPSLTRPTTRARQGRDKAVRQGRDKAAATRQTLST